MSKKIAILFPGQGSQYEGMGRDLIASPVYKRAKEILDDHTYLVVEEASLDQLSKTRYGQVAIFLNSLSLYQELKCISQSRFELGRVYSLVCSRSIFP